MFGIDSLELLVVGLVALVVIGPKELPRVMRQVGQWLAKGRAMTRHVRAGFDTMMREAELEDMQKQWAAQNEAIMKASALPDFKAPDLGLPNYSADEWMSPAAAAETMQTPEPSVAEAPAATPKKRTRRAKPAETTETPAPPKPKKPRRKAEPQPTET